MINILMYHGFTDKDSHDGIMNHHGKHLNIKKFEEQICFLKAKCHIISLTELIDAFRHKQALSKHSVVITIDDGYRSNYTLAYPILLKHKVPAAIFVTTDFIDQKRFLWFDRLEHAINKTDKTNLDINLNGQDLHVDLSNKAMRIRADQKIKSILKTLTSQKRDHIVNRLEACTQQSLSPAFHEEMYHPLSWSEIRTMQTSGLVTIGSHSCSHPIVTKCSFENLQDELSGSKQRIEAMTQSACFYFSYPNGHKGDFNATTKAALMEHGYHAAFTTVIGSNDLNDDCYELKRLNIHDQGDLSGFQRTLSPFFRFLRGIKDGSIFRP